VRCRAKPVYHALLQLQELLFLPFSQIASPVQASVRAPQDTQAPLWALALRVLLHSISLFLGLMPANPAMRGATKRRMQQLRAPYAHPTVPQLLEVLRQPTARVPPHTPARHGP